MLICLYDDFCVTGIGQKKPDQDLENSVAS